ncbi:MAG: translocation/assembly module TamB domain-containing protein [Elusimicrobiota bacterium]|nr:translocation/assembly module TamB domain-containing protein [Elusimicrobiota bacterium]
MKTLLKIIVLAVAIVLAFFAFFPFEEIMAKIESAVSSKIADAHAGISYGGIESDFFRTVTLSDVTVNMRNGDRTGPAATLNFKKVTLYFPIFFVLRKGVSLRKIALDGSEIRVVSSELLKQLKSSKGAPHGAALPAVIFRNVRVVLKDRGRAFCFNGRLDNGHLRVHIRSGHFSASARADMEKKDFWKINGSVKNMNFFSMFLSTPHAPASIPLLKGENFRGAIKTVYTGGKLKNTEIKGVITAASAVFPGIFFPPGKPFELRDIKSVLSVSKGAAEFSKASGECEKLRMRGDLKIGPLSGEPLCEGLFKAKGDLNFGDTYFEGVAASVSMEGFLKNPVFKISGSASNFKKGAVELKNLTAAASFNDRNARCFRIEYFDGKYGRFDVDGEGRPEHGALFINGGISGVFESGQNSLEINAPYELGKNFKAWPEVDTVFQGRKLSAKGDILYSVSAGTACVKLSDITGDNVFSANIIKDQDGARVPSVLLKMPCGELGLSGGVFKTNPAGFSFSSFLVSSLPFWEDRGRCSLSYTGGKIDALFSGADNFLKYSQLMVKKNAVFSMEGKAAPGEFNVSGRYASGNLKGSLSAGKFRTDFVVAGGSVALSDMSYGKYAAGDLILSQSISGRLFVKDCPLKIKAIKKDDRISAMVKIKDGAFKAEISGENFAKKISGTVSADGLSALNINIPDPDLFHSQESCALSGDFQLIMAGVSAKAIIVPRAMIRAGDGRAEFIDISLDLKKRAAQGRMRLRNIKKGFANIFANSVFEITYSSNVRITGKADDVFINAFYTPFEFDVLIAGDKTVFFRPNERANGIRGVLSSSGGELDIFTGGSKISACFAEAGEWNLKTETVGIQKILKLFSSDARVYGDMELALKVKDGNYKIFFDAPDIYTGTRISAKGSVAFDGVCIYPDVRVDAAGGFFKTSGYIAAAAGQVNKFLILANNVRIPNIQTEFGEVKKFFAEGEIRAGGTYEMPEISGKIISSFGVKHKSYPETVDFSLDAHASGGKIIMSSTGIVKGANFKLTGEAFPGSGGVKSYSVYLYLPEKGVPVVVPGLLIQRKKALRYIFGATPSRGKVSGSLSLVSDGEKVSVDGSLKIKDARFSYKKDSSQSHGGSLPDMNVTLVFDKNVEWVSDKFKADIYGSLNIKGPPYEVNGKISSSRGRLSYLGKNLSVDFAEVDIVKNKIFLTLQAEAEVSRKNPNPPFQEIPDTIKVDIKHSPLDSLDINLGSAEFSEKTSGEQAYQMITGVPSATGGDIEFMKNEIAKMIDSSVINPFFSELVRETGLADDVRLDVPAIAKMSARGDKLEALDIADRMNLYMGKSFGRMYIGYNVEFMRDISSLELFHGFEMIYRIRGGNVLKAVYQPDESGEGRKYLGVEKRIRF